MLVLTTPFFAGEIIPEFCFFEKGNHIAVTDTQDVEKAAQRAAEDWKKCFEEVNAVDAESALRRLADLRQQTVTTEHAFITGSVFSSLLTAILK